MSGSLHPDALKKIVKQAADKVEPAHAGPEDDPLRQMIYSFLLWEAPASKVDAALQRIDEAWLDVNEMRISLLDEYIDAIGERYPRAEHRTRLLQQTLNEIYLREHAVSLDSLKEAPKRDARKYLDSIEAMPPFVASRVLLLSLGGHAFPVDDQMLQRLLEENVIDEDADVPRAAALLERSVKAAEARGVYLLLEAWSDPEAKTGKSRSKSSRTRSKDASSKAAKA